MDEKRQNYAAMYLSEFIKQTLSIFQNNVFEKGNFPITAFNLAKNCLEKLITTGMHGSGAVQGTKWPIWDPFE